MNIKKNQQHQKQKTMKKKCNQSQHIRKVQHFKKKLYHKLHMQTKIIPENNSFQLVDTIQIPEFQKLSISQPSSPMMNKKKCNLLNTASNTDPTLLLSDYSMISDIKFKEVLFTSTLEDINTNVFINLLNNKDIFVFIRQLTQLINRLNYSKLQYEQWTYYYNLGMTQDIWSGRVSKKMAGINSMYHTYGRSKILIVQRQQKYKQQFEQIENDINEHIKQATAVVPIRIDITEIMNIINNFIDKDQYQLRIELERRRNMLLFDAKEHQLVHEFYQLKPRQTEIHSARIVWKAIHHEQLLRYEIAIFKKWLSIQNPSLSYTFRDLKLININHIFTKLVFQTKQTSIDELAHETLAKAEEMAQFYAQKVFDEKNRLLHTRPSHKNIQLFDKIRSTIINRENNMIQRLQYDIQQKLLTVSNQIS